MEKKNNNMITMLLTILVIVVVGVSMFFVGNYVGKDMAKEDAQEQEENNKEEQDEEIDLNDIVIDSKKEIFKDSKVEGLEYTVSKEKTDFGINVREGSSKKELIMSLGDPTPVYPSDDKSEKKVTSPKKISKYYLTGFGLGAGSEHLFALAEDGTVYYLNVQEAYNSKDFTLKQLPGVKDVVRFVPVSVYHNYPNRVTASSHDGVSLLAQKANGEFYNTHMYLNINHN